MKTRHLMRTALTGFVLVCFLTVTSACYGPFNLTKNVYHWNSNIKGSGEVNEKWMKEIVFFGMIVIPVYILSPLIDAFIFNPIQFWTGDNPLKATDAGSDGATRVVRLGAITMTMVESDRGTQVTYERNGILERRAMIETSTNGYRLIDDTGALLAEAEMGQDRSVMFLDRDCQVVGRWTGDQLMALVGKTQD